jgi:hypothetical protein
LSSRGLNGKRALDVDEDHGAVGSVIAVALRRQGAIRSARGAHR